MLPVVRVGPSVPRFSASSSRMEQRHPQIVKQQEYFMQSKVTVQAATRVPVGPMSGRVCRGPDQLVELPFLGFKRRGSLGPKGC